MHTYFSYFHSLFTVAFGNELSPSAEVMLREYHRHLKVYDASICFRTSLKQETFQGLACEFRLSAAVGELNQKNKKTHAKLLEKKEYVLLEESGKKKDICVHFSSKELKGGKVLDLASLDTGCVTVSQKFAFFPQQNNWK